MTCLSPKDIQGRCDCAHFTVMDTDHVSVGRNLASCGPESQHGYAATITIACGRSC